MCVCRRLFVFQTLRCITRCCRLFAVVLLVLSFCVAFFFSTAPDEPETHRFFFSFRSFFSLGFVLFLSPTLKSPQTHTDTHRKRSSVDSFQKGIGHSHYCNSTDRPTLPTHTHTRQDSPSGRFVRFIPVRLFLSKNSSLAVPPPPQDDTIWWTNAACVSSEQEGATAADFQPSDGITASPTHNHERIERIKTHNHQRLLVRLADRLRNKEQDTHSKTHTRE